MNPTVQTSRPTPGAALEALVAYVLAAVPRLHPGDWQMTDPATLRTALGFHAAQGTLRVQWGTASAQPIGLAIVWQDFRAELEALEAAGKDAFRWNRTQPDGDCLYLGLVIGTAPHVMRPLAKYFRARFPALPEFAHRHGRLRAGRWLQPLIEKG